MIGRCGFCDAAILRCLPVRRHLAVVQTVQYIEPVEVRKMRTPVGSVGWTSVGSGLPSLDTSPLHFLTKSFASHVGLVSRLNLDVVHC